jgi:hypothetical protein
VLLKTVFNSSSITGNLVSGSCSRNVSYEFHEIMFWFI